MIELLNEQIKKNTKQVNEFLTDNNILKQGIYLKIDIDKRFNKNAFKEYLIIGKDYIKTKKFLCELDLEESFNLFDYVRRRDVFSNLLNNDANKAIDGGRKKILSTVYMTLSISNKFSPLNNTTNEKSKFTSINDMLEHLNLNMFTTYKQLGNIIEDTLNIASLNKKSNKENEDKVINKILEEVKSKERTQQINFCQQYLNENLEEILRFVSTKKLENEWKIKIFLYSSNKIINDDIFHYEKEYNFYLTRFLFNKGTGELLENRICALTSIGFNNNSKKPFIRPRGMNIQGVKLFNIEQALDNKKTFDLLHTISSNTKSNWISFENITSEEQFRCNIDKFTDFGCGEKGLHIKFKEGCIVDYDLNSECYTNKNCLGYEQIELKNYLIQKSINKENASEYTLYTIKDLLRKLVHCTKSNFNKYSDYNVENSKENMCGTQFEETFSAIFERYKIKIDEFLMQDVSNVNRYDIDNFLDRFMITCVKSFISFLGNKSVELYELKNMLNIRLNLLNRFQMREADFNMLNKINNLDLYNDEFNIDNDNEFYFLVGQVAYFLETRKKTEISAEVFKFYTEKRNNDTLKKYIISRFELYSYNINANCIKLHKVLSKLYEYNAKKNIQSNIINFYYGVSSTNIILKKNVE